MLIHCLFLAHRCVKRWLYSASSSDLKLHYRGWGGVQKEVHALIKQQHWHHLGNPRILLSKHVTQVDGAKKEAFDHSINLIIENIPDTLIVMHYIAPGK